MRTYRICLGIFLAAASIARAASAATLFSEGWESGADRWGDRDGKPLVIQIASDDPAVSCSSKFQRELGRQQGGQAYTLDPIEVAGGGKYCLSAWIRARPGGQPFLGVHPTKANGRLEAGEQWLIGTNDDYGKVVRVTVDDRWHWVAAPFSVDPSTAHLKIKDENWQDNLGDAQAVDFDDLELREGECPSGPGGGEHASCADPKPLCDTGAARCVECLADPDCGGATPRCDLEHGVCIGCRVDVDCGNPTSGRVCDAAVQQCKDGCRGRGGNGCPMGRACTSKDESIGLCAPACNGTGDGGSPANEVVPTRPGDVMPLQNPPVANPEAPQETPPGAAATPPMVTPQQPVEPALNFAGGGCGCVVDGRRPGTSGLEFALGALLVGIGLRRHRNRHAR